MKTITIVFGFLVMTSILGCADQKQTPEVILANKETRDQVMGAISDDNEMMNEMMAHMMQSDHTMQMMEGNQGMMVKMMGNHQVMMQMMEKDTAMASMMMDQMMGMMEKDSTLCNTMCKKMGGNKHMMDMMQQMGKSGNMMKGGMMHHEKNIN